MKFYLHNLRVFSLFYNYFWFLPIAIPSRLWEANRVGYINVSECHNSKFSIFELLVQKETFADVLLTGIVS